MRWSEQHVSEQRVVQRSTTVNHQSLNDPHQVRDNVGKSRVVLSCAVSQHRCGVAAKSEGKGLSISLDSVYIKAAAGINGDGVIDSAGNGGIMG